jgi:hypothetical protein
MAPRDGSGTYTLPFPPVVTNTTISSAVENGTDVDIAQDLNTPRPIVAGGTGGSSATQALFNLSGEKATQNVTNWDSQVWLPGSFYAATSATGTAPVAAHAFAGICYLNEPLANPPTNQNLVTEATDLTDSANTQYLRVMTAGVWGTWTKIGSTSAAGTLGEYTFDTGTSFPPASGTVRFNNATQNSTTELFISHLTANGVDVTSSIPLLKAGNDIAIQDKNTSTSYKIFTATAGPVLSGGDCRILVTAKIAGSDFANTARLLVNVPGGPAVRYDAPQGLTYLQQAQGRSNIGALKKNYIINGAMMVSQENGLTAGSTNGYFPADQFIVNFAGTTGTMNIGQMVLATPSGSPNRIQVRATAADATMDTGDVVQIATKIEGLRVADLLIGTAAAKTITLQFGVKAPAGTYCVAFRNANTRDRRYVAEYTIVIGEANVDVIKSITLTLDTTGTWPADNIGSLEIIWTLMAGSTNQTTAGSWGAGSQVATTNQFNFMGTVNNTFNLFDVGLYEGAVAPPFMVPDFASELAVCMRYWQKTYTYAMKPGTPVGVGSNAIIISGAPAASTMGGSNTFPVPLRAAATGTTYSNAGVSGSASYYTGSWNNGGVISMFNMGTYGFAFSASTSGIAMMYNFDLVANARL